MDGFDFLHSPNRRPFVTHASWCRDVLLVCGLCSVAPVVCIYRGGSSFEFGDTASGGRGSHVFFCFFCFSACVCVTYYRARLGFLKSLEE